MRLRVYTNSMSPGKCRLPPQSLSLVIEPLTKNHNRNAFSCGNQTLDRYLQKIARQDASRGFAAPFVAVTETDPQTILGYYTLSSFSIDLGDLPEDIVRKLPSYSKVPFTLLGRLAIDQSHQHQKLGKILLYNALQRVLAGSSQIGSHAVVVDAIDDNAISFYQHFGFIQFPDNPSRLFLPMKTIADLL